MVHLCYVGKAWLGCVVFPPLMHKMKLISIGFAKCCNIGDCVQTSGTATFEGSCGPQWCVLQRTEGKAGPAPFPQSDCLALYKKKQMLLFGGVYSVGGDISPNRKWTSCSVRHYPSV